MRSLDVAAVGSLVELIAGVDRRGGTLYVAGDGGSAALASHVACDLAKLRELGVAPSVRSLVDNAALLTMVANDHGFEEVFARQIAAAGKERDAILLISGSGRSPNLLRAAEEARHRRIRAFALLGFGGVGPLREFVDDALIVHSGDYRVIEDVHHAAVHAAGAALAATAERASAVVVVERDGVLCVPSGDEGASFRWLPGVPEAIAELKRAGWTVIVATNEPSIPLGLTSPEALAAMHARMNEELGRAGGRIDEFYICPHGPEAACGCHKPRIGMIESAAGRFGFRSGDCAIVGASSVDSVMGQRAGARTIIVGTGATDGNEMVPDFPGAVRALLGTGR